MELSLPILSVLVWFPILAGIVVLLLGSDESAVVGKFVALAASILTFAVSIFLCVRK